MFDRPFLTLLWLMILVAPVSHTAESPNSFWHKRTVTRFYSVLTNNQTNPHMHWETFVIISYFEKHRSCQTGRRGSAQYLYTWGAVPMTWSGRNVLGNLLSLLSKANNIYKPFGFITGHGKGYNMAEWHDGNQDVGCTGWDSWATTFPDISGLPTSATFFWVYINDKLTNPRN